MLNSFFDFFSDFFSFQLFQNSEGKVYRDTHSAPGDDLLRHFYSASCPTCIFYPVNSFLKTGIAGEGKVGEKAEMPQNTQRCSDCRELFSRFFLGFQSTDYDLIFF